MLQRPEYEVCSLFGVEVAYCKDGTTTVYDVEMVGMAMRARLGAEVEVCTPKHTTNEVPTQQRMSKGEGIERGLVMLVESGLEHEEAFCR